MPHVRRLDRSSRDRVADRRLGAGRAAAGGGRDRRRQDERAGVRLHRVHARTSSTASRARRGTSSCTPGGSSGGSAAALAGGVLPLVTAERRRRLDPHPGELHRLLRAQAVVRPRAARAARRTGSTAHGGLRAADEDGRGRGAACSTRSSARRRAIRRACRIPASPTRRAARGAAAGAAHRLLAGPRLRGRAVRRRRRGRGRGPGVRDASATASSGRGRPARARARLGAPRRVRAGARASSAPRRRARPARPRASSPASSARPEMTPARWRRARRASASRLNALVRRRSSRASTCCDADGAVRPSAGRRPVPDGDRGHAQAVVERRRPSRSRSTCRGTPPRRCAPASRARGLPIGLQIVGPRHRDDLVLQAARAFERERPWHPDWPSSTAV